LIKLVPIVLHVHRSGNKYSSGVPFYTDLVNTVAAFKHKCKILLFKKYLVVAHLT